MRSLILVLVVSSIFFACDSSKKESIQVDNGVPLTLATFRKKQVSNVTYNLKFNIPDKKEEKIPSILNLEATISDTSQPLYLDFKVEASHIKNVAINGKEIAIIHNNEHIKIPRKYLLEGKNSVTIDFFAGEQSLNRNDEFLYTLLVPDRARTLFPCFDQPNIKANYVLEIIAPKDWNVLCGAKEIQEIKQGDYTKHVFAPTDLMSTYLFSFVAGKFEENKNIEVEPHMIMLYRETNTEKITESSYDIFNLHQQSLDFLEDYTAYTYPFQKFDFATIPGFQYGGMEHVGAIQYRESALFLDKTSTKNQKLRRAKLIAHETSHMWFGDLVTMDWFNDVWMKEVFANFMADKIVNPAFPNINHDLAFLITHYPRAYSEDRTLGTNAIRQKLDNLNNAGSLYGRIIYNKAPIMMRQLETAMGSTAFKKGIQEYINKYANGNAVWNDLITILDANSNLDIQKWSEVWVNNSGRPIFEETIVYDENERISSFKISQFAEDKSKNIWPQKFTVDLIYTDSIHTVTVDMKGKNVLLKHLKGMAKPKTIIYNSNGLGYGVFPVHKNTLENFSDLKNEVTRGHCYINLYENVLNGKIAPKIALEFYQNSLLSEKNELLINLLSNYTTSLFWNFISQSDRDNYQKQLASQLWRQLNGDVSSNTKKVLFAIFRSIAYSEETKERLYKIWSKETEISNLKLNTDDYTITAFQLALFEHPKQEQIVEEALKRIDNPDKKERFKFIVPSVSKEVSVRNLFFESLKKEGNREKEAWVLAALGYLNHQSRQSFSIENLRASLDLLEEIQKTGDIFFPKGWLNNTIGLHTSPNAYETMQKFIKENPDLNPSLLKKLLQASDNLRRAQLLKQE